MFGVVPRTLWERKIAPDDRNRIPLGMRCLLVEHPDGLVLVDTGAGNKESPKFHTVYGIEIILLCGALLTMAPLCRKGGQAIAIPGEAAAFPENAGAST